MGEVGDLTAGPARAHIYMKMIVMGGVEVWTERYTKNLAGLVSGFF